MKILLKSNNQSPLSHLKLNQNLDNNNSIINIAIDNIILVMMVMANHFGFNSTSWKFLILDHFLKYYLIQTILKKYLNCFQSKSDPIPSLEK